MKFIISLILTALLSFGACLYLPWWSIAIVALLVAVLIPQRPSKAFFAGFIALFLLWGGLSFWLSSRNDHMLAQKIAAVLGFGNSYVLIAITALVAGLVAGLAALTGSFLRASRKGAE